MLQTIQGIYRNGKIELLEIPQGVIESQVFVTFLTPQVAQATPQLMSFGMFTGKHLSIEADFEDAEFRGDLDDALNWA